MATETMVGGIPVSRLKEALKSADDENLAGFLRGYALGFGADQFIIAMTAPNERAGFIFSLASTYPEDWAKATEALKKLAEAAK
jgi:hypothetical protein